MNIAFLPEDYTSPKSSNYYMKLQDGENKIRILTQPVFGWEDWKDKKPIRFTMDKKPAKPINEKMPIKHFWSFIVWNYNEEQIQILHITQATVRNSIETLCKDSDWGAPFFYDIKIIKKGEKMDTEYLVNPLPHKPLNPEIIEKFNARPCNLNAIFENLDPFSEHWDTYSQGIFTQSDVKPSVPSSKIAKVSKEEAEALRLLFDQCDENYQIMLRGTLKKMDPPVNDFYDLPLTLFERIKGALIKKRDEHASVLAVV